ncbi:MAG: carbonic anhydrase [Vulcanimicrobiaceae bacterium]
MSAEAPIPETVTDAYLRTNADYAKHFAGPLPPAPAHHTAVVACMDSRLDVYGILGLHAGDAHLLRNAGGVVTDDVMRSLVISQRLLGTVEIILMHHTGCGMLRFTDDEMRAQIAAETGSEPPYAFHAFADLDADVRAGIARIRSDPHLPHRDRVRGFTFDLATGKLHEVT